VTALAPGVGHRDDSTGSRFAHRSRGTIPPPGGGDNALSGGYPRSYAAARRLSSSRKSRTWWFGGVRPAGNTHNPFDEILGGIFRILENDDIMPLGIAHGEPCRPAQWIFNTVTEFVHQDMIPNQQSRNHGAGRNLEGLHHKSSDEKCQQQGNNDCLRIFTHNRFFHGLDRSFFKHV